MKQLRLLCVALGSVLAFAAFGTGCSSDPPATGDGGELPDGGVGGAQEFTVFVRDLILNETRDDNLPTSIDDKTFVDTPPADVFPASFFP